MITALKRRGVSRVGNDSTERSFSCSGAGTNVPMTTMDSFCGGIGCSARGCDGTEAGVWQNALQETKINESALSRNMRRRRVSGQIKATGKLPLATIWRSTGAECPEVGLPIESKSNRIKIPFFMWVCVSWRLGIAARPRSWLSATH